MKYQLSAGQRRNGCEPRVRVEELNRICLKIVYALTLTAVSRVLKANPDPNRELTTATGETLPPPATVPVPSPPLPYLQCRVDLVQMIPVGVAYEGAQDAVALGFVETELEICRRQLEVGLVRRQPEQDVLLVEVAELDAAGTAWRNVGNGNEISRIALSVKLYAKVKFLAVQRSVREEGRVIVRRMMIW